MQPGEQVGEAGGPAVPLDVLVAVDGLAEQGHLLDPLIGQGACLVDDRLRRSALFGASDAGDDAVGAELVATHHDPHERLEGARAHRRLADRVVLGEARRDLVAGPGGPGEADGHLGGALLLGQHEQFRDPGELAGPGDHVDVRRPLQDEPLILLGHAAQDADRQLGLERLEGPDPPQGAVDLVLGVLPDGAGVVEDRVRLRDVVGQLVPLVAELAHDQLAVEQVHLATDRLDVELLAGGIRVGHRRRFPVLADRGPTRRLVAEAEGRGRTRSLRGWGSPRSPTRRDTSDCIRLARCGNGRSAPSAGASWRADLGVVGSSTSTAHPIPREDVVAPEELGDRGGLLARHLDREQPDGPRARGDDEPVGVGFEDLARLPLALDGRRLVDDQADRRRPRRESRGGARRWTRSATAAWRGRGCGPRRWTPTSRSPRPPCGASGPW